MAYLAKRKRNPGLWAWFIRRGTRSRYDHCEILTFDGVWYSSLFRSGGWRRSDLTPPGQWDLDPILYLSDAEVVRRCESMKGWRYDVAAIVGHIVRGRWDMARAVTCSGFCATVLGVPQADSFDPNHIGQINLWANEIWSRS